MTQPLLRLGVSACLLGEMVRYDGGHQRDRYLTDVLGDDVEWHPVCPEVEIGLGVPRPTIRLQGDAENPRLVEPVSGADHTESMETWSQGALPGIGELDGFVFKKDSPSCGPDRVKRYAADGGVLRDGMGVFARALTEGLPWIPVVDDGRLKDPGLRENFLDHAMWMRRWRDAGGSALDEHGLMEFHRIHKVTYMSHHPEGLKRLGQLAASGDVDAYLLEAATTMSTPATAGRHANALQHMSGYVSDSLDPSDREELANAIHEYREGLLPLLVPLTLLRHHVRRQDTEWLRDQTYLNPYPKEWRLRLGL